MITLDYHGDDCFRVFADDPVWGFLDQLYRRENRVYVARYDKETGSWIVHLQYFAVHCQLFRSERVETLDRSSKVPGRTMTVRLRDEIAAWERRLEAIQSLKEHPLETPAGWDESLFGLKLPLRPYQQAAALWMFQCENGILSDDPGAGKSACFLSYALAMLRQGWIEDVLIVAPLTLARQWVTDGIQKFVPAPYDDYQILCGETPSIRRQLWKLSAHWTIVNYEIVRGDIEQITDRKWGILLADEAQVAKTRNTKVSRALKRIPARYRFVLSATPLELHLVELFSLYEFVNPGVLGNFSAFVQDYVIMRGEQVVSYRGEEVATQIPAKIGATLLRRTKAEILPQLPPVVEQTLPTPMTAVQETLYHELAAETEYALALLAEKKGKFDVLTVIERILRLRQICDHPALFHERYEDAGSGKVTVLEELLGTVLTGKVICFSFFAQMIERLEQEINAWKRRYGLPLEVLVVTGATDAKARELIRQRFNFEKRRFLLLSTDCMRYGVNLQAAQAVIHYDLAYNPATKVQRTGRAHRVGMDTVERLGCDDTVFSYSLITPDTVEERIQEVVVFRERLFATVMAEGDPQILGKLTREELLYILTGKRA